MNTAAWSTIGGLSETEAERAPCFNLAPVRRVSKRLAELPGSATMATNSRARELMAQGRDVISFAAGEPDFPTPEHIVAAATRAAHNPAHHHYTAAAGLPELRVAVAAYTREHSGAQVDAGEVAITNGAKQAVFNTFAAILDPGDEVLLPSPYWVTYPASVGLAGGIPIPIETGPDGSFKVTVQDLEAAVTERTRALVLVSPSNPTGSFYRESELAAIGEWAAEKGLWVVADEIYQRLVYPSGTAPSMASAAPGLDDLILINGVAKSYAMTGWRVGWMVGPKDVVDAAVRLQSHATSNVNNVAQAAALAALTGPQDAVEEMREAFDRRRKLMYRLVSEIEGISCSEPEGAFYVFPDVRGLLGDRFADSAELAEAILEEAGSAVIPGESFGMPGFIRLSYAASDQDITTGLRRIAGMFGSP